MQCSSSAALSPKPQTVALLAKLWVKKKTISSTEPPNPSQMPGLQKRHQALGESCHGMESLKRTTYYVAPCRAPCYSSTKAFPKTLFQLRLLQYMLGRLRLCTGFVLAAAAMQCLCARLLLMPEASIASPASSHPANPDPSGTRLG